RPRFAGAAAGTEQGENKVVKVVVAGGAPFKNRVDLLLGEDALFRYALVSGSPGLAATVSDARGGHWVGRDQPAVDRSLENNAEGRADQADRGGADSFGTLLGQQGFDRRGVDIDYTLRAEPRQDMNAQAGTVRAQ